MTSRTLTEHARPANGEGKTAYVAHTQAQPMAPVCESAVTADSVAAAMDAAGIDGYVVESDGALYIPVIAARVRGKGHCSRWLDSLPDSVTIKIPGVLNYQLAGMLARRGFLTIREWSDAYQEWVEVYVRRANPILPCDKAPSSICSKCARREVERLGLCSGCFEFMADLDGEEQHE